MSVRQLGAAAGVAASTVHRIETGRISPTVATLRHLAQAGGERLEIASEPDYASSLFGLGRAIAGPSQTHAVRMAAEVASRFLAVDPIERHRMIAAEPLPTADERWDAFLGGMAEWLAVRVGMLTPAWALKPGRYLGRGWWLGAMKSMEAWEYAGSPLSFKLRGVYIHRESLLNV